MKLRYQLILFSLVFVFSGLYMIKSTIRSARKVATVEYLRRAWLNGSTRERLECFVPPCIERLTKSDLKQHYRCLERMQGLAGNVMPKENGCFFLSGRSRAPVALASFPGSGNTWIRQLLEASSGVCTGSTMCDMSLRYSGFTGESITSGSVLVVKTHKAQANWISDPALHKKNVDDSKPQKEDTLFQSAILIVRNPLDALVSEWSRRVANNFHVETVHLHAHTKEVGKPYFGSNKKWAAFVQYQATKWQELLRHWLIEGRRTGKEVLVVHYEQLHQNRDVQLKRILEFLGIDMAFSLSEDFGLFHRQHKHDFEPYTNRQKQYIRTVIINTIRELEQNHMKSEANLTQYLL